jgi:hypothetical protein
MSQKDNRARRDGKGSILVWLVRDDGALDKSYLRSIPMSHPLTDPDPLPPGKRGRRVHQNKTWRGWAYDHPDVPEAVIKEAKDQGCYLGASANYITVGFGGRKLFVVFRSGVLGFNTLPKYCLAFKHKKVAGRFSSIRLPLRAVVADGLRIDIVRAIRQYIGDCKVDYSKAGEVFAMPAGA